MANYGDFNFADDAPGPDTDPVADNVVPDNKSSTDGIQNDVANYPEPGETDAFKDGDPTVFSIYSNAEEPGAQQDHVAPIISDDTKPDSERTKGLLFKIREYEKNLQEESQITRDINNAFLDRISNGAANKADREQNSFFGKLFRRKLQSSEDDDPLLPDSWENILGKVRQSQKNNNTVTEPIDELPQAVNEPTEYFDKSIKAILTRLYGTSFATDRIAGQYTTKEKPAGSLRIFDATTYSDIPDDDDFWGSNSRAYILPIVEPYEKRSEPSDLDQLEELDDVVNTKFDDIAIAGLDEDLQPDLSLEDPNSLDELDMIGYMNSLELADYVDDTTNDSQLIEFQNPFAIEDYYGLL